MHVSSSIVAGSPKSMNQPLELQLGFLRPTDFPHPRSQSNRICTLPETYCGPTHFSHLGGRSFSRRLSFHLSSQTRYRELHPFYMHSQIHPESTLICLCTRIPRRTWRTKHDNFHYRRFLESCLKKKFPGAPCTCCSANASSNDILHWGESTKVR